MIVFVESYYNLGSVATTKGSRERSDSAKKNFRRFSSEIGVFHRKSAIFIKIAAARSRDGEEEMWGVR